MNNNQAEFVIRHHKLEKVILNDPNADVVIPSSVYEIAPSAFSQAKKLRSVVIPESVSEIYRETFIDCVNLEEVKFMGSISRIGEEAFKNCKSLRFIDLPEGLKEIESDAFAFCSSLREINFPSTLIFIGTDGFRNCTSLLEAILPDGLESMSGFAFDGCTSLYKIYLPSSLDLLCSIDFHKCSGLREVHYDPNIPKKRLATIRAIMKDHGIESPIDTKKKKLERLKEVTFYALLSNNLEMYAKDEDYNISYQELPGKARILVSKGNVKFQYDMRVCSFKNMSAQLDKFKSYVDAELKSIKVDPTDTQGEYIVDGKSLIGFSGSTLHIPVGVEKFGPGVFKGQFSNLTFYLPDNMNDFGQLWNRLHLYSVHVRRDSVTYQNAKKALTDYWFSLLKIDD